MCHNFNFREVKQMVKATMFGVGKYYKLCKELGNLGKVKQKQVF